MIAFNYLYMETECKLSVSTQNLKGRFTVNNNIRRTNEHQRVKIYFESHLLGFLGYSFLHY